jgi:hypothetical protein
LIIPPVQDDDTCGHGGRGRLGSSWGWACVCRVTWRGEDGAKFEVAGLVAVG